MIEAGCIFLVKSHPVLVFNQETSGANSGSSGADCCATKLSVRLFRSSFFLAYGAVGLIGANRSPHAKRSHDLT
jgi:hypothetical protein